MLVPVWDENSLKSIQFQFVTIALIVANVIVFILQATGMPLSAVASFALVPSELFQVNVLGSGAAPISNDAFAVPERYTLLSYMFFHGDILHLASNMIFLWVFGDNVEDAMGHFKFFVFYMLCGIFAGLTHAWLQPDSQLPLIGASGAVAGVIAAYLMLHPRVRVWVLVFRLLPIPFPFRLSAAIVLGLWIALQVVMVMMPEIGPVAWWAHIGGLVAGAVLILFMRRPGVMLFDGNLQAKEPA